MKRVDQLIVEAHSDDAALSIGGYLIKTIDKKRKILLDVFSTCGCTVLRCLKSPEEITYYNNKEEEIVASKLNLQLKMLYLPESFFRYPKWNAKFDKQKDASIMQLIEEKISNILDESDAKDIFFPLAIGNHPDHTLLFNLFLEMNNKGRFKNKSVFLYEDLPYAAEKERSIEDCMQGENPSSSPILVDITECMQHKIDLTSIYRTQYSEKHLEILGEYASKIVKNDRFYERIWEVIK